MGFAENLKQIRKKKKYYTRTISRYNIGVKASHFKMGIWFRIPRSRDTSYHRPRIKYLFRLFIFRKMSYG